MSNIWDKHRDETYTRAAAKIRPEPVTYHALQRVTGISIPALKKYLEKRPMLQMSIGLVYEKRPRGRRRIKINLPRGRPSKSVSVTVRIPRPPPAPRGKRAEFMERLTAAAKEIHGDNVRPTISDLASKANMTYLRALTFLRREFRFRDTLVAQYQLVVTSEEL